MPMAAIFFLTLVLLALAGAMVFSGLQSLIIIRSSAQTERKLREARFEAFRREPGEGSRPPQ